MIHYSWIICASVMTLLSAQVDMAKVGPYVVYTYIYNTAFFILN